MSRSTGSFIRDNIEAFAVAIAMALVIRHYCVEAFRIPTGSMKPSLYGDDQVRKQQGDRILVDKVAPQRADPRRWEVWVFHFPGNRSKNYIKRLVGLPNEWLAIADGDLWTSRDEGKSWQIQRKPPGVQDELLFGYYPEPVGQENAFADQKLWKGDAEWRVDEPGRRFEVDAGPGASALRFDRKVVAYDDVDTGWASERDSIVGDVRVSFRIEIERAGELAVSLTEHGRTHRLVLGRDESHFEVAGQPHERFPVALRLRDGGEHEISFANVDNALHVSFDGDEYTQLFDGTRDAPPGPQDTMLEGGWGSNAIELEATGLGATILDLAIERDLHYIQGRQPAPPEGYWKIPAGCFFALGDNTQSSRDSREWKIVEVELENGYIVRWDPDEGATYPGLPSNPGSRERLGDTLVSADVDGLVRRFGRDEVRVWRSGTRRQPFVSRGDLVGRAFSVFWPIFIPPAYSGPTRVKLIR